MSTASHSAHFRTSTWCAIRWCRRSWWPTKCEMPSGRARREKRATPPGSRATEMTLSELRRAESVGTETGARTRELRELSPKAHACVESLGELADRLERDERLGEGAVTRPHPLIIMVRRG